MTQTSLEFSGTLRLRSSKRAAIAEWFADHPGLRVSTGECHAKWGTAFRTRVSEINRDPTATVTICNHTSRCGNIEESCYWGHLRN